MSAPRAKRVRQLVVPLSPEVFDRCFAIGPEAAGRSDLDETQRRELIDERMREAMGREMYDSLVAEARSRRAVLSFEPSHGTIEPSRVKAKLVEEVVVSWTILGGPKAPK